jgi:hypothetical protein
VKSSFHVFVSGEESRPEGGQASRDLDRCCCCHVAPQRFACGKGRARPARTLPAGRSALRVRRCRDGHREALLQRPLVPPGGRAVQVAALAPLRGLRDAHEKERDLVAPLVLAGEGGTVPTQLAFSLGLPCARAAVTAVPSNPSDITVVRSSRFVIRVPPSCRSADETLSVGACHAEWPSCSSSAEAPRRRLDVVLIRPLSRLSPRVIAPVAKTTWFAHGQVPRTFRTLGKPRA